MAPRKLPPSLQGYFRSRVEEFARPETRAVAEPLAEWACRKIRLDGRPFTFEGHAYLRDLYDDSSPHVVLMKAAQIGGTVWAILRSIHSCLLGLDVIYLFPTRTDVLDFSRSRVGPLIEENPFLARAIRDTDTTGLKRIGSAHLYLRGMQSAVGLKSVPADVLVFDELDEATPDAKTRAKERLSHSAYRRTLELSNPSLPGYGIDEVFQQSDQRSWTIRCDPCGAWTALDLAFPNKLGEEVRVIRRRADGSVYRACPRCEAPLDIEAGEWVPAYPDRPIHGYRISQLFSARVDPAEILTDYETTRFPSRFFNLKIGIPWADTQNRVDRATVLACCGQDGMWEAAPGAILCTMGVDTGRDLHVVITRPLEGKQQGRQIVYLGVQKAYSELDDLIRRFQVAYCVIDALPELHAARDLAARHPGKVWLNYFSEHQKGEPAWDCQKWIVQENRTEALDLSREAIRLKGVVLPRAGALVEEFATHMANDAKRLVEDEETGEQAYRYIRTGPDHFSLAFTYDCIAAMRQGPTTEPIVTVRKRLRNDPILDAVW